MKRSWLCGGVLVSTLLLTGCDDMLLKIPNVEDNTPFKIDNLAVPLRVKDITLRELIDEGDIKVVNIGGLEYYALSESGSFSAETPSLGKVSVTVPQIAPVVQTVALGSQGGATRAATTIDKDFTYTEFPTQAVSFSTLKLADAIQGVKSLKLEATPITISIAGQGVPSGMQISFHDIEMQFIKGLQLSNLSSGYTYDPTTGILKVSQLASSDNGCQIKVVTTGIDFEKNGAKFENGVLYLQQTVQVKSLGMHCSYTFDPQGGASMPETLTLKVESKMGTLVATHFSGRVAYSFSGSDFNLPRINLTQIPEEIRNNAIDLRLANPQIYLSLNNPIAVHKMHYETGLCISSIRKGVATPFLVDDNAKITIPATDSGMYNFVLAPNQPVNPLENFAERLKFIRYSGLSNLLSGQGLPDELKIDLLNPQIPAQDVVDLDLSKNLPKVYGSYYFLAPLALKDGSKIIYSSVMDVNLNTNQKSKFTKYKVEGDISTDVPFSIKLRATLLYGNGEAQEVGATDVIEIPANAKAHHIEFGFEGELKSICGIKYEVELTSGAETPLAPSQKIHIDNLKFRVSGTMF